MNKILSCYTLFDITSTKVSSRYTPSNLTIEEMLAWKNNRNRQCNFDTILQVVSLRIQPENISDPIELLIDTAENRMFGFLFDESVKCWKFNFSVQNLAVFHDGYTELGALYRDCEHVPMIKLGYEPHLLTDFLDTSVELRNIFFEVLKNE